MTRQTTQAGPGSEFFTRREVVLAPVAAEDLVAWYPFREGTGADITAGSVQFGDSTDYSATVNGATYQPSGGVTDITTGTNSGAFDLDGVDDTLDLGTVADSDQSLTVMTWLRPDTVSKNFMRILTKADGNDPTKDGTILLQLVNGGDNPRVVFRNNGNAIDIVDTTPLSVDLYVHLSVRYNFQTGDATLFRNGQPVGSATPGQLPALASQPWRVGEDNPVGTADFLDGTVDGTRIYQAALSDSQINQIYLNTEP